MHTNLGQLSMVNTFAVCGFGIQQFGQAEVQHLGQTASVTITFPALMSR